LHLLINAGLVISIGVLLLIYPVYLIGTKTPMTNITDPAKLSLRRIPDQREVRPDESKLHLLRSQLAGVVNVRMGPLEKAVAVRQWCRAQQSGTWDVNDDSSSDPLLLLDRQRQGIPGTCRRFAWVLAGSLEAIGLDARVVSACGVLFDSSYGSSHRHALVEVWIPDLRNWVLMDSMYNATYLVDGRPASLYEVSLAFRSGRTVSFDRNGATTEPTPVVDHAFKLMFNHLLYSRVASTFAGLDANLFGNHRIEFAHHAMSGELYPETLKQALLALGEAMLAAGFLMLGVGLVRGSLTYLRPPRSPVRGIAGKLRHNSVARGQLFSEVQDGKAQPFGLKSSPATRAEE
jgi:hypothetical protein